MSFAQIIFLDAAFAGWRSYRLGHDRTTAHVVEALKERIAELPAHL